MAPKHLDGLTAQRWRQIQELADLFLDHPESEWPELAARFGDDTTLWDAACHVAKSFSDTHDLLGCHPLLDHKGVAGEILAEPGGVIGAYRIIREIGRGGMATVYLAERADEAFSKTVALKIVRAASRVLQKHFRSERRLLADFEHENIARLHDGGTTESGLLYLIMEYVDGVPIDVWRRERDLGRCETLRLFLQVARAVAYAHGRGVQHRDLKPSNILVNRDGVPKLLDFGIASDRGVEGRSDYRALTPAYASPEQQRGEPLTFATDVYSLALILRQLLPGPFPDRDMDCIARKALAVDPGDRYESAKELAEDVERYLNGYPVHARRRTLVYRTRRFIGRHRVAAVACGFAIWFALINLIIGFRPDLAIHARAILTRAPRRSVQLLHFNASALRPGSDALAARLDQLFMSELPAGGVLDPGNRAPLSGQRLPATPLDGHSPEELASLRATGAETVLVGEFSAPDVHPWSPIAVSVRLIDTATGHTVETASVQGSIAETEAVAAKLCRILSEQLGGRERLYRVSGARKSEAAALLTAGAQDLLRWDLVNSWARLERAANRDPSSVPVRMALVRVLRGLGLRDAAQGELAAVSAFRLDTRERADADALAAELSAAWQRAIKGRMSGSGSLEERMALTEDLTWARKYPEAGILIRTGLASSSGDGEKLRWMLLDAMLSRRRDANKGSLPRFQAVVADARKSGSPIFLGIALERLAEMYVNDGFYPEAIECLEEARDIYANQGYRSGLIHAMTTLGRRTETRDLQEAIALMEEAARIATGAGLDESESRLQQYMGRAYLRAGMLDRARSTLYRALELSRKLHDRGGMVDTMVNLGVTLRESGMVADARNQFLEAIRTKGEIPKQDSGVLAELGETEILAGNPKAALEHAKTAIALARMSGVEDAELDARLMAAHAKVAAGDYSTFDADFRSLSAREHERGTIGSEALAEKLWGGSFARQGKHTAAIPHLRASAEQYTKLRRARAAAESRALLAMSLAATGSAGEARRELDRATDQARDIVAIPARLAIDLATARVSVAEGKREEGIRVYQKVQKEAAAQGFTVVSAEAQAALDALP